jgi:outer membrane lipoprotein LolB
LTLSRALVVGLFAALVGACATVGPAPRFAPAPVVPAFDAAGRLSARHGNDGVTVHFTWTRAADGDVFDVATPFGQTVARLRGGSDGVLFERSGKPPARYADWNALMQAAIGVAIPIDGLASWLQGAPAPHATADVERDQAGRPRVLRQQGWEIVYTYDEGEPNDAARPARLILRYPGAESVEVRIVIDRFAAAS